MKKMSSWYSYRLIVPALLILPPLGLILLWKSPRTPRAKLVVSVMFVAFLTGAFVGVVRSGLYARYLESRQPPGDVFDVRMDSRNAYVSKEILPFERKIFAAVVRNMRTNSAMEQQNVSVHRDIVDYDSISLGTRAFQAVGDEYGLDYDDVQKIYRKVSAILAERTKK